MSRKEYSHIVPETYQKKWKTKNGKSNVYYFKKNNINESKSGNVDKHMGIENCYFLNSEDAKYFTFDEEREIETFLSVKFENSWNDVHELYHSFLEHYLRSPGTGLKAIKKDDLFPNIDRYNLLDDFLFVQHFRRLENVRHYISATADLICPIYCGLNKIEEENKRNLLRKELDDPQFVLTIWKNFLLNCKNEGKQDTNLIQIAKTILKDFTKICFFSNENFEFILSDNPVIYNIGANKTSTIPEGIFFPIDPEILIAFIKFEESYEHRENLILATGSEGFIKHINYLLLERSYVEIGYRLDKVAHLISEAWSQNFWDSMVNYR